MSRVLGRSGITVSEIGFGCWAIGGPFTMNGKPDGWGAADDGESVVAIRRAVELGITLFDTADVYGAGHSEEVLGRALAGHRGEVVIATKFGALGWLLARSPRTVPIPGIRTIAQAEQNAAALARGPLAPAEMAEIARLLGTATARPA